MNFDLKNGCKNEFEDNNEKSCSRLKNVVPLKIDFRADWTHESNPPALELIKQNLLYLDVDVVAAQLPVSVIILSQIPVS